MAGTCEVRGATTEPRQASVVFTNQKVRPPNYDPDAANVTHMPWPEGIPLPW